MSGAELVLGSVLFAFQIYGDFSGYSDIAIGTARLFGFELMVNFRTPYFSRDIAEFWRRWHISLSTWFRDYLYIPLGGSRGGVAQAVRNTFVIFVVSGLWHGANWTFVVWGGLNALYFLPLLLARRNRSHLDVVAEGRWRPSPREVLQLGVTFSLTCLAWVFFRAPSVSAAFAYLAALPANPWWPDASPVPAHLAAILVLWLLAEWATRRAGVLPVVDRLRAWQRYPLYYLLFLLLVLFGQYSKTSFIYFQF